MQADTATQAGSMLSEFPATPVAVLFSLSHRISAGADEELGRHIVQDMHGPHDTAKRVP
jgi:hypothetical protein